MYQRTETLDRRKEPELSVSESIVATEIDRPVPQQGDLRPLARALVELAISLIEEEKAER